MKPWLYLFIIFGTLIFSIRYSLSAQICIVNITTQISESIPKGNTLFLAGTPSILGNWAPDGMPLERKTEHSYQASFEVDSGTMINFKVTRGSWDSERVSTEGYPLPSTSFIIDNDTLIQLKVEAWKDQIFQYRSGVVGEMDTLQPSFSGLDERPIYVYRSGPIQKGSRPNFLLVHDGQNAFDPRMSTLGIEWLIDDFLHNFEQNAWIEPTIAVFVPSSKDRNAEYSPGGKGQDYLNWIDSILIPEVEDHYSCTLQREQSAAIGASMGGLASMMCLVELPRRFSKAACLSSAFQIGPYDYTNQLSQWVPKGDEQLILYNGGQGLEVLLQAGNSAVMGILDEKGIPYTWICNKEGSHDELAWSRQVPFILLEFFGE